MRGRIANTRFLDLYAGTGAVGIEALKEGASEVVFVEASRSCARIIDRLIQKFDFSVKARVIIKKVVPFIEWAEANHLTFDIIFLDPPYHTDDIMQALSAIGRSHILTSEGLVVAEHFVKKEIPDRIGGLKKIKEYRYGDSVLSLYNKGS